MFESLRGKRLLVLGSTSHIVDIVNKAHEMGVSVVVTDYVDYSQAPAKQVADEYLDISLSETQALAEYIESDRIDGILTGFTDSYLPYYYALCHATGLPCYGDKETFEIATDKKAFKLACIDSGVNVIPGGFYHSYNEFLSSGSSAKFPLIFKPVDNSGSRGVVKCDSALNAERDFEYAKSFSESQCVVCESFMSCPSIGVSYQIKEGKATLSSACDRVHYRSPLTGSTIVCGLIYPSRYLDRYIEEMHQPVLDMLKKHNFRNGMLSLQAFVDDNTFYQCEMCYRPSGGKHYVFIEDQCGVDELKLLIEYALTGQMDSYVETAETPYFKDQCMLIHVLGKGEETIASIGGIENLNGNDDVLRVVQHLKAGSKIGKDGTTAQTIATIWCKVPVGEDWLSVARKMIKQITCTNSEGDNLVIPTFDDDRLSFAMNQLGGK